MTKGSSSPNQSGAPAPSLSLGNPPQKIHNLQPRFDFDAASPNDDGLIRGVISQSVRFSEKSREQIAEEMAGLLGVRVTEKMLNTYSAESMIEYRLPAAWLRAFCYAVDSDALLRAIAQAGGYYLITAEEKGLLDLGREYLRQKRASEKIALIEAGLRGMEAV